MFHQKLNEDIKMNTKDKRQLERLRKSVNKERKRLHLNHIKFSVQCDNKTKKVIFAYLIDADKGLDINNNRLFSKKRKRVYIKDATIYDVDFIINNLKRYVDEIEKNMTTAYKMLSSDRLSIKHWARVYCENRMRRGNIKVSETTLRGDRFSVYDLIEYLEEHKPKMLNINKWPSKGKDTIYEYMKHRQVVGGIRKKWNNTSVNSSYRRIRAFMNFISENEPEFPDRILNEMHFVKNPVKTFTFTDSEIDIVKQFIVDYKDDKTWSWFVPIVQILLETGMRISEVKKLKISNLEFEKRRCLIKGKGRNGGKPRWIYFTSDSTWKLVLDMILDDDGDIRTDKEHIFHFRCYKWNQGKQRLYENIQKSWSDSGITHKFKKMIRFLNINDRLTTHDTRRYFITKMLIKTNGNIPLVAQLVGHNTWDMVRLYCKNVIQKEDDLNVNLFAA